MFSTSIYGRRLSASRSHGTLGMGLFDRLIAEKTGADHLPRRVRTVRLHTVQHTAVVPDDSIPEAPFMAVDGFRRCRPTEKII